MESIRGCFFVAQIVRQVQSSPERRCLGMWQGDGCPVLKNLRDSYRYTYVYIYIYLERERESTQNGAEKKNKKITLFFYVW